MTVNDLLTLTTIPALDAFLAAGLVYTVLPYRPTVVAAIAEPGAAQGSDR